LETPLCGVFVALSSWLDRGKDVLMLKAALAAVLGLATVGQSLVFAEDDLESRPAIGSATRDRVILTGAEIVHIKAVLRLTREQEQYWPAVEAALRAITGHAAQGAAMARPLVLDQTKVQRLAAAAMPLLMTLDEGQKRAAAALARSIGLGPLMAAF
jgi:hypothetical protein